MGQPVMGQSTLGLPGSGVGRTRFMKRMLTLLVGGLLVVALADSSAQDIRTAGDPSPHRVQLVKVDQNVQLEVLDWGGSGRAIVLLAGLGNTAHIFDDFAPQLVSVGRVYGVTRRGYGASSSSSELSVERLGDDVRRVLGELKIGPAVLVGHSIAGQELSYLASRFPQQVVGAAYLEAGYRYAFMPPGPPPSPQAPPPPLQPRPPAPADLASVSAYRAWSQRYRGYMPPESEVRQTRTIGADGSVGPARTPASVGQAISGGMQPFSTLGVPVLVIFASPHDVGPWAKDDAAQAAALAAFEEFDEAMTESQAQAFEAGVPHARVVRIRGANHYVFMSHRDRILDELRVFITSLR